MSRAQVLRSVQQVLAAHKELTQFLGHVKEADTVARGARIVGDSVRLENLNGALPLIILSFDNGQALTPQREYKSWELECFLYTEDVFDAATLLDLIEDACVGYRNDGSLNLPQRLVSLRPGDHNRVASERNTNYLIEVRFALTASWVS